MVGGGVPYEDPFDIRYGDRLRRITRVEAETGFGTSSFCPTVQTVILHIAVGCQKLEHLSGMQIALLCAKPSQTRDRPWLCCSRYWEEVEMSNRKGFTLIELVVVVVIIGVLAAIAIPKFANTKERALITAMKSDLRNLITVQESYFASNEAYTDTPTDFNASSGVSVAIGSVSSTGWAAVASHTGTSVSCAVAIGAAQTGDIGSEPTCG